jgi:hypothetical protein
VKQCWSCRREWTEKRSPGCREECAGCGQPLHCCANCRFYDARATPWCLEPQARAERPRDEAASNTCTWFVFRDEAAEPPAGGGAGRAELAGLFGEAAADAGAPRAEPPAWQQTDTPAAPRRDEIFKPPDAEGQA